MKKFLLIGISFLFVLSAFSQSGYVDLGLVSGTKWKSYNESSLYTYEEAVDEFGNNLPSYEQLEELKYECKWTLIGNSFKVVGPNGNYITFPFTGFYKCGNQNTKLNSDRVGCYWSLTSHNYDNAYYLALSIHSSSAIISKGGEKCRGYAVRLVTK